MSKAKRNYRLNKCANFAK